MALFRNIGVHLRVRLCDVLSYVSAQTLDFLDLAENFTFLIRKLRRAQVSFMDGHYLRYLPRRSPTEAGRRRVRPLTFGTAAGVRS